MDLEPEYKAIMDAMEKEGLQLPTKEQQLKDNQLLKDYKETGMWPKTDVFLKFTEDNPDYSNMNWVTQTSIDTRFTKE